jgi:hypothetical protein
VLSLLVGFVTTATGPLFVGSLAHQQIHQGALHRRLDHDGTRTKHATLSILTTTTTTTTTTTAAVNMVDYGATGTALDRTTRALLGSISVAVVVLMVTATTTTAPLTTAPTASTTTTTTTTVVQSGGGGRGIIICHHHLVMMSNHQQHNNDDTSQAVLPEKRTMIMVTKMKTMDEFLFLQQ